MRFRTVLIVMLVVLIMSPPADCWWRRRRRRRRSPPPPESWRRRRRRRRSPTPIDTTPPTFRPPSCPRTISETTTNANGEIVQYSTPVATDDRGSASVRKIRGPASGSRFRAGSTTVTFRATDPAGNTADCSIIITVRELRCNPAVSSSSPRTHSCTNLNFVGSVCTFHCPSTGYDMNGQSTVTCRTSQTWNRAFPTCQVKTCSPSLTSLTNGGVTCTNANRYNSICTFRCNTCFGFTSGGTTYTRTCRNSWSGSTPSCQDTCAPTFTSCPSDFTVEAESALTSAVASWPLPTATDNVRGGVTVARTRGDPPGSRFNDGSHSIRYRATDARGNTRDCTFTVTIRVVRCTPTLQGGSGQLTITCPLGNIKGATCTSECDRGYKLAGPTNRTCQSNGAWTGTVTSCEIMTCASNQLPAPVNGIKSGCVGGYVAYGGTCILSCNHGYRPTTSVLRTCQPGSHDGVWSGGTITCTIVRCPPLSAPSHGTVSSCVNAGGQSQPVTSSQTFGSHCSLVCHTGYTLFFSASRGCLASGVWDGNPSICLDVTPPVVQCPTDRDLFAGHGQDVISITWNWEPVTGTDAGHGITASLLTINSDLITGTKPTALDEGTYTLVYQATDSASNSGSCSMQIEAKVTRCPALPTPAHGSLTLATGRGSCSEGAVYGSRCDITCETGYTLSTGGAVVRRNCLRSSGGSTQGYWDSSQPTCVANTCILPSVTYGYITGCHGDTATYTDSCEFHCLLGHRSGRGESFLARQCQADGTWSGPNLQCTVVVTCPGFFSITHVLLEPSLCSQSAALPYNTMCHFSCSNGFRLEGPPVKTCLDDGSWNSLQNVICIDEQNPRFTDDCPQHMTVDSEFGSSTQIVTFDPPTATDNSGFVTVTRQTGHLPPGSRFSEGTTVVTYFATDPQGNLVHCDVIITVIVSRCGRLQAPSSGSIHCDHTSHIAGTVCTLECNTGYDQIGSATRTCQLDDGGAPYWDGDTTECSIVRCPSQPAPPNAIKSGCSQPTEPYGAECSFYCVNGYEGVASDGGRSRCLADGTWSGTDLVCNVIECPALEPAPGINVAPPTCRTQPVFGRSCMFSCPRNGFRIDPVDSTYVHCVGNGQWSGNVDDIQCIDVNSPEFDYCPNVLTIYAGRDLTTAQLDLEITATDNGDLQPTVTCDPGLGHTLDLGIHWIACVAEDAAGNTAACTFEVEVVERMCTALAVPAYGEIVGDCCSIYSCVCHLGCISGYQLVGSSEATCEYNGNSMYWQRVQVPHCQLITCDAVSLPTSVLVTPHVCLAGTPVAGTHCFFFCLHGLTLIGGVSHTVCKGEGTWDVSTDNLPTDCRDFIPPVLTFCPGPIYATRNSQERVSVTFDLPTARDNNPFGTLTLETSPVNITSPYLFTESTEVSYTFTDESDNSITCVFRIFVLGDLEPEVVFCPGDYSITAYDILTDVTWDQPVFRDPFGEELVVNNNVAAGNTATLGWGRHTVVYTAVNEANGQKAACQFAIDITPNTCPPLASPKNGALSCIPSGHICSAFCSEDYEFQRARRGNPRGNPGQYVCGLSSGRWSPNDRILDCSRRRADTSLLVSLMYFSGDCSQQSTQDQIATAFIALIQASPFMDACSLTNKCNIENVQVMCGVGGQRLSSGLGASRRRRRATVAADDEKWDKLFTRLDVTRTTRQKRDADTDFGIFIVFDIKYAIEYAPGVASNDAVIAAETRLKSDAADLMRSLGNGSLPAPSTPDVALEVDADMMSYDDPKVVCEPGYVISNDTLYCTACSSGTWYNQATEECDFCSKGTYQDQQAMETCQTCPPGTTTVDEASKNSSYCKEECPAGHYSINGVLPCFQCLTGFYQSQLGQTSCLACPAGATTLGYGAQSLEQCLDICLPGSYSSTGLAPCSPCEPRYYQPASQKRHCVLCPGRTTTLHTGSSSINQCIMAYECESSPCEHGATCVDLINGYRCDCLPGYQGVNCQENVDDCVDHQCANNATCVDGVMGYLCQCQTGFEGEFCEIDIDECVSSPCQHDGLCLDVANGYRCQCTANYHGLHCEQEIHSCSPSPCRNGAMCMLTDGGYQCQCSPGYAGINCTLDINECASSPCLNDGTCYQYDGPNAYRCFCPAGYEGARCADDVDWCADAPCHIGSTCLDLGAAFICVCPPHWSGRLCDQMPCQNGGLFVQQADSYQCYCQPGYQGHYCQVDINECLSSPCSNGGTCTEPQPDAFTCNCPAGFQGTTCGIDIDECLSTPCGVGATCEDDENGYTCHCGPGMTGTHCQDPIDYCAATACLHGATCISIVAGYRCECAAGFTGRTCETNIDDCLSTPCQHGGFCVDRDHGVMCFCLAGFMGSLCEINIDDCSPSACQNGGTCVDGITEYTCFCPEGFTGAHCREPINYCISHPCQHQGTCQNIPWGYRCLCPAGYVGRACEEDFDECSLYPCLHATSCADGVDSYECLCEAGYEGTDCDVEVDECRSDPCQHGGTCLDMVAGVLCRCAEGYDGAFCQEDVDQCLPAPCLNEAICVDRVNAFICLCQLGWTGDRCGVNIDDCASDPCLNGGECLDGLNAYVCQCSPGYLGVNCQTDINECQQPNRQQCDNGATCLDKVANFECLCTAGYGGRYCEEDIDECGSSPCQNGANCVDGVAAFSCTCPAGYTGVVCDREVLVYPCTYTSCSNGATCLPQGDRFTCNCADGYSGDHCDLEIDECASQPCLNYGSCQDLLNGYQCTCLLGYTGVRCETELPTDFDLKFSNLSASESIQVNGLTSSHVASLSVSLWLRSQPCPREFLLAQVSSPSAPNVLEIKNPFNLQVKILGHDIDIGGQTNLCDGRWHNLMLTLKYVAGLEWRMYTDQLLTAEGAVSSPVQSIPGGLGLTFGLAPDLSPSAETSNFNWQVEMSGVNVWRSAWSEADVSAIAGRCVPVSPGDVFAWGQVMALPGDAITQALRAPSLCDDYDECSSSPCEYGGICEDQLGAFLCHCPEGRVGHRCQTADDFCPLNPCLNDGLCQSQLLDFLCHCPQGYTGRVCQNEIVDGRWSTWMAWSECSQTCGAGSQLRFRSCNDPEPRHGGTRCLGEIYQLGDCNVDTCPVCPVLRSPSHGFIDCNGTADGGVACAIWCRDNYEFSTPPQSFYRCGPSTDYRWDHNPEGSLSVSLPSCNLIVRRVAVAADVTVTYPDLLCSSPIDQRDIVGQASASLHNATQGVTRCLADNTCAANVSVSNCETEGGRSARSVRKRMAKPSVKLTFLLTMDELTADKRGDNGSQLLTTELDLALEGLADLLQTGELGIAREGVDIAQPDLNTLSSDTWDVCPEGAVESETEGLCVQCSRGMVWVLEDGMKDSMCEPCPVSTYKDELTNRCIECPPGMVTVGPAAANISECFVPSSDQTPPADTKPVYHLLIACGGGILAVIFIGLGCCLIMNRMRNRGKKCPPVDKPQRQIHIIPDIFDGGPASNKNTQGAPAANPVGDVLSSSQPTVSDVPVEKTKTLHLPSTRL